MSQLQKYRVLEIEVETWKEIFEGLGSSEKILSDLFLSQFLRISRTLNVRDRHNWQRLSESAARKKPFGRFRIGVRMFETEVFNTKSPLGIKSVPD